ncbi:MAG: hypothetical protein VB089_01130 [Anaerolineaceae bacterium]|nr:hypothetical protein [Anaerolineaceae bacterium]
MERLIAKYHIELDYPILVKRSDTDILQYQLIIDDAEVEVWLIVDWDTRNKFKNERFWTSFVNCVEITVSLSEQEIPPPAEVTPKDGHGSYYEIEQYFKKRITKFTEIAKKVYRRLVKYFKYVHGSPYLVDEGELSRFPLPLWSDEKGTELWKTESRVYIVPCAPGESKPEFGIIKFTKTDDKKLVTALRKEIKVTLYQEIMSDAQAAILKRNYRRGILEMAIACEIAVKQAFFTESTISGVAYEYIENQGRVNVRPIDLISNVAEYVFGENFKSVNETAYKNIDYLFRCRNKIAHRGQISYRDDSGVWHQPNLDTLRDWWTSLEEMLNWLYKKNRKLS